MSNRRHLWKGIHDQEWVKGGVRVEAHLSKPVTAKPAKLVEISVDVLNSAVGHKFPTYITPKIFVRTALLDGSNKTVPGTQQERIIGWDARFEGGEWKEYFDTRISPGDKFTATFRWPKLAGAKKIRAWVEVHPDHFYHVHFYPSYLKNADLSPDGRRLIQKALADSSGTYLLYNETFAIN